MLFVPAAAMVAAVGALGADGVSGMLAFKDHR